MSKIVTFRGASNQVNLIDLVYNNLVFSTGEPVSGKISLRVLRWTDDGQVPVQTFVVTESSGRFRNIAVPLKDSPCIGIEILYTGPVASNLKLSGSVKIETVSYVDDVPAMLSLVVYDSATGRGIPGVKATLETGSGYSKTFGSFDYTATDFVPQDNYRRITIDASGYHSVEIYDVGIYKEIFDLNIVLHSLNTSITDYGHAEITIMSESGNYPQGMTVTINRVSAIAPLANNLFVDQNYLFDDSLELTGISGPSFISLPVGDYNVLVNCPGLPPTTSIFTMLATHTPVNRFILQVIIDAASLNCDPPTILDSHQLTYWVNPIGYSSRQPKCLLSAFCIDGVISQIRQTFESSITINVEDGKTYHISITPNHPCFEDFTEERQFYQDEERTISFQQIPDCGDSTLQPTTPIITTLAPTPISPTTEPLTCKGYLFGKFTSSGSPPAYGSIGFTHSNTWQDFIDRVQGLMTTNVGIEFTEQEITAVYNQYKKPIPEGGLGRFADIGGLQYWLKKIADGLILIENLGNEFKKTDEWKEYTRLGYVMLNHSGTVGCFEDPSNPPPGFIPGDDLTNPPTAPPTAPPTLPPTPQPTVKPTVPLPDPDSNIYVKWNVTAADNGDIVYDVTLILNGPTDEVLSFNHWKGEWIKPGNYEVTVTSAGFLPKRFESGYFTSFKEYNVTLDRDIKVEPSRPITPPDSGVIQQHFDARRQGTMEPINQVTLDIRGPTNINTTFDSMLHVQLKPGKYQLNASAPGYLPWSVPSVDLVTPEYIFGVHMAGIPGYIPPPVNPNPPPTGCPKSTIEILVTSATDDSPVNNVTVSIYGPTNLVSSQQDGCSGNASKTFNNQTFMEIPRSGWASESMFQSYDYTASAPGYETRSSFTALKHNERLRLYLQPVYNNPNPPDPIPSKVRVTFTARDPNNNPVNRVTLSLNGPEAKTLTFDGQTTVDLNPGFYTANFSSPDNGSGRIQFQTGSGGSSLNSHLGFPSSGGGGGDPGGGGSSGFPWSGGGVGGGVGGSPPGSSISAPNVPGGSISGGSLSPGGRLSPGHFSGGSPSGGSLSGGTLSGSTLSGSNLSGGRSPNGQSGSLNGASWSGGTINNTNLSGSSPSGSGFSGGSITGGNLSGGQFSGGNWVPDSGGDPGGGGGGAPTYSGNAAWSGGGNDGGQSASNITHRQGAVSGGSTSGGQFSSGQLSGGSQQPDGRLTGVTLTGSTLSGASLSNTTRLNGSKGTLTGGTLSGSTLSGATISGASVTDNGQRVTGGRVSGGTLTGGRWENGDWHSDDPPAPPPRSGEDWYDKDRDNGGNYVGRTCFIQEGNVAFRVIDRNTTEYIAGVSIQLTETRYGGKYSRNLGPFNGTTDAVLPPIDYQLTATAYNYKTYTGNLSCSDKNKTIEMLNDSPPNISQLTVTVADIDTGQPLQSYASLSGYTKDDKGNSQNINTGATGVANIQILLGGETQVTAAANGYNPARSGSRYVNSIKQVFSSSSSITLYLEKK